MGSENKDKRGHEFGKNLKLSICKLYMGSGNAALFYIWNDFKLS